MTEDESKGVRVLRGLGRTFEGGERLVLGLRTAGARATEGGHCEQTGQK